MGAISLFIKPDGEHMAIKSLEDIQAKIEEIDEVETSPADTEEVEDEVVEEPEAKEEGEAPLEEEVPSEEPKLSSESEDGTEIPESDGEDAYVPDLKFKAMKEEYEIPEFLKNSITNKEQEEELKKVFSKAYGLDHFTSKNEQLTSEVTGYKQQLENYAPIIQSVSQFNAQLDKGQLHEAMKTANISDDSILQLASKIIELRELTPQQQTAYNNQIESNHRLHQLEVQNQNFQQQFARQAENQQVQVLDNLLASEGVSSTAKAYDNNLGESGAFRKAVINHAAMIEFQTKDNPNGPTILTPQEAVDRVIKLSGIQPSPVVQSNDVGITQTQTPTNQTVVVKKEKPTLPNVKAGGKSPVKQKVKTLADLEALRDGLDDY